MVASILTGILSLLMEMDHVATSTIAGKTTYTFKTTAFVPSLVEMKSKVLSVLDTPVDIPEDITVREVKKGPIFREYLVDIVVDSRRIGQLTNVLAKKYGFVRRRAYTPG